MEGCNKQYKEYYCSSCSLDSINNVEVLRFAYTTTSATIIFYLHSHVVLISNGAQVLAHCSAIVNTTTT